MTTQLSTKLAALAVALMMNSLMIGGVAYLFNGQLHQGSAVHSTVVQDAVAASAVHGPTRNSRIAAILKAI